MNKVLCRVQISNFWRSKWIYDAHFYLLFFFQLKRLPLFMEFWKWNSWRIWRG